VLKIEFVEKGNQYKVSNIVGNYLGYIGYDEQWGKWVFNAMYDVPLSSEYLFELAKFIDTIPCDPS